jgi:hypothetical protein
MLDVMALLTALVLWSGYYVPAECRERIQEAVAAQRLKWLMEIPHRPLPSTCEYLLTPEERETLFPDER